MDGANYRRRPLALQAQFGGRQWIETLLAQPAQRNAGP